jgi:hypothetical protein
MKDKITKAILLRERGGIERDEHFNFIVPSSDGSKNYIVSGHHCNCPSVKVCCHLLATTYLDALLTIELLRYAESEDFLKAIVEVYSLSVEAMPAKVRAMVRSEYSEAKKRLQGAVPERYTSHTIKDGDSTVMVVSRQESPEYYGSIQVR